MSLPDPATIPETAYLVIGYRPGEDDRFIGDEDEFYFLSNEESTHPHFFKIDFDYEDQLKILSDNYKQKFDIVIFDTVNGSVKVLLPPIVCVPVSEMFAVVATFTESFTSLSYLDTPT